MIQAFIPIRGFGTLPAVRASGNQARAAKGRQYVFMAAQNPGIQSLVKVGRFNLGPGGRFQAIAAPGRAARFVPSGMRGISLRWQSISVLNIATKKL